MNNYNVREFTKNELDKYLTKLGVSAEISLGLLSDFGVNIDVADPFFDDAYEINVKNKKGYIAGTNERSILFGVYRLLEAAQDDICRKNASISTVFCTLAANAWKENR